MLVDPLLPVGLATPATLVFADRLEHNLAAMATFADAIGVALRPHAKTHKCLEIARRQMLLGARGLSVATVGEAEILTSDRSAPSGSEVDDVFVAYPLWPADDLDSPPVASHRAGPGDRRRRQLRSGRAPRPARRPGPDHGRSGLWSGPEWCDTGRGGAGGPGRRADRVGGFRSVHLPGSELRTGRSRPGLQPKSPPPSPRPPRSSLPLGLSLLSGAAAPPRAPGSSSLAR